MRHAAAKAGSDPAQYATPTACLLLFLIRAIGPFRWQSGLRFSHVFSLRSISPIKGSSMISAFNHSPHVAHCGLLPSDSRSAMSNTTAVSAKPGSLLTKRRT